MAAESVSGAESGRPRVALPNSWTAALGDEAQRPYFKALERFVEHERGEHEVFPPADDVFEALNLTPFDAVRVILLGQDPYHGPGQANGLCFSVRPGVPLPPSLRNIYRELRDDIGCTTPQDGGLGSWARQGVLLLNTVLTVRSHAPGSHRRRGWEQFTDRVIERLCARPRPAVFVLWGHDARRKAASIDRQRHSIIESAHPSPLSAYRGFFGSRPFSAVNAALRLQGESPITWELPGPAAL